MTTKRFTLIEVLFAVIILALSLGVTLAISAQAKGELIRAKERWIFQHTLEQATEYFLVADPGDLSLPDTLLPEGFDADCQIDIVSDDLPEFAMEPYRGWILAVYIITITDSTGEIRGEQIVHKLLPEDAVH